MLDWRYFDVVDEVVMVVVWSQGSFDGEVIQIKENKPTVYPIFVSRIADIESHCAVYMCVLKYVSVSMCVYT